MNNQTTENNLEEALPRKYPVSTPEVTHQVEKQWSVSMDEVAKGIGTKTDVGKLEMHLIPAQVYSQVMLQRFDYDAEPKSLYDLLDSYFMILAMIQKGEMVMGDLIKLKLDLARLVSKQTDFTSTILALVNSETQVLMYGKYKYSADNWRKIDPPLRYFDACGRHLFHMMSDGIDVVDEESGLPAHAHVECNLSFLAELLLTRDPYDGYDKWVEREKAHR